MPEFYTIKSNARRAARKAGVDPETVYCVPEGWKFPEPPAIRGAVEAVAPNGWDKAETSTEETAIKTMDEAVAEIGITRQQAAEATVEPAPIVPALGGTPAANSALDAKVAKRATKPILKLTESDVAYLESTRPPSPMPKRIKAQIRAAQKKAAKPATKTRGKRDGVCDRVIAAIHARWTSIDELMKLSGWQRHTLRGYISTRAGKDGFTVERKKIDDVSHYRVAA